MSPRKPKDVTDDDNYWKLCIEEAPLNDDTWTVKVILMEAAGSEYDRIYLNKFENYAAEERRFVIKNICKTETVFMINQLGGEKKVKDDKLRVFEEGQLYLKDKKDVPSELMALVIKHLILKMKEEYLFIEQQKLEVREGMRLESFTMISKAEVKGAINVKTAEPLNVGVANNKRKTEQEPIKIPVETDGSKKYNTLLRVRGEEWRDKIYIDDFPINGPNLYVCVTGFLEPNLAGWLIKFGVPLTAVVQIRIDLTSTTIPSNLLRNTKRQSQTEVVAEKSIKFWETMQQLRINRTTTNDFKNTAFIVFKPPYWNSDKLSGCNEIIYDELSYLMYDIQDLTRQHSHYLENMDIIPIPEDNKLNSYQIFFKRQLDQIPLEAISTYLVLDVILQTVVKIEMESTSVTSFNDSSIISNQIRDEENKLHKSEKLVRDLVSQLCKIDSNDKKYEVTNDVENQDPKDVFIINYGDFCKAKTFHLDNVNLDEIVCAMLFGMPINKLWISKNKPTEEINITNNFHINMILSCFDRSDMETDALERLLHILAFRKLYNNRSSLKKNHLFPSTMVEFKKTFLKRSILAEPLSKYSFHKFSTSSLPSYNSSLTEIEASFELINEFCGIEKIFECPDISELVSATEIANKKPINHMIDDYDFFQDFTGSSALQVTLDAFNKFNCVDYKYCEVTDCFIMMFYNSHNKDRISREEWRCHLPTPLCLEDFFDFVLEEHYDWIKNEEKIYDENILFRSQSENKNIKKMGTENSCVEHKDMDLELVIEGSLKYEEIKNFEVDLETSTSKVYSSKKNYTISNSDLDSMKSGKKTKSPAICTPKIIYPESEDQSISEAPKKPFSGYDLGDRRVEVFGKDSTYFAKDGTRVSTFYSLLIPMNLEYLSLNMIPGNFNNEFWIHKRLGDVYNSDTTDIGESFRIITKDQLILNLKKNNYNIGSSSVNPMSRDAMHRADPSQSTPYYPSNITCEQNETKSYQSLIITWPNGLITESVYENNSSQISHIKQYYMTSLSNNDEDMRCLSLNGEVIIFTNNNEIEILKPDSSCIKILKCEKKIDNEDKAESVLSSVTTSDKTKKEKINKISSKPSKKVLVEDKIAPSKEVEYKLFIHEYETTESNGLRQKWTQNNKFDLEKLLIKTATDFCLGEIFSIRSDGTTILLNKDGDQVVTFTNGTRIITSYIIEDDEVYPEWTDEEIEYFSMFNFDFNATISTSNNAFIKSNRVHTDNNSNINLNLQDDNNKTSKDDGYVSVHLVFTIEHPLFTTVTINKYDEKISIKSPNDCCVTFDSANNYDFTLDKQTSARFDGENLNIKYCVCSECNSYTNCDIRIKPEDLITDSQLNWLNMTDSSCKIIVVDEEGNINVSEKDIGDDERIQKMHSHHSTDINEVNLNTKPTLIKNVESSHNCKQMAEVEALKFFILRRDLTCSELVHRATVERYKEICCKSPWCSINHYDTFGDNRNILSILAPINRNESEKWLMNSKLYKPKQLTYKDLVKDSNKGFYHWMRPYKRFKPKPIQPNSVLPNRPPRAFILRTLEQQWQNCQREEMKGARELIKAILRYRNLIEEDSQTILNVPIKDPRPENQKKTDDVIQDISNRIYRDLKFRLEDYAQTRAKPSLVTKPILKSSSVDEFKKGIQIQDSSSMSEPRNREITVVDTAVPASSKLKRYWNRRAEEYKEEQFYKYLLREGSVPPYFQNVLGGAIWWDMNKTADNAVTSAEKRRMKCVCDDE